MINFPLRDGGRDKQDGAVKKSSVKDVSLCSIFPLFFLFCIPILHRWLLIFSDSQNWNVFFFPFSLFHFHQRLTDTQRYWIFFFHFLYSLFWWRVSKMELWNSFLESEMIYSSECVLVLFFTSILVHLYLYFSFTFFLTHFITFFTHLLSVTTSDLFLELSMSFFSPQLSPSRLHFNATVLLTFYPLFFSLHVAWSVTHFWMLLLILQKFGLEMCAAWVKLPTVYSANSDQRTGNRAWDCFSYVHNVNHTCYTKTSSIPSLRDVMERLASSTRWRVTWISVMLSPKGIHISRYCQVGYPFTLSIYLFSTAVRCCDITVMVAAEPTTREQL